MPSSLFCDEIAVVTGWVVEDDDKGDERPILIFKLRPAGSCNNKKAELAQLVERTTLNRVVEGSIPSFGVGSSTHDIVAERSKAQR